MKRRHSHSSSCKFWTRTLLIARLSVAFVPVLASSTPSVCAPLNLPDTPYNYTVINQDLQVALLEFGSNLNLKVNVSPEVRGRIQGRLPDLTPRAFLDRLSALYNLEWYFDGVVLYVTSARESQTRLLVLGPIKFQRLKATLDAFGVSNERYTVQTAPGANLILASGPPRFVALVEQTLTGLIAETKPPEPRSADQTILTVFRGAHMTILRNGRPEFAGGMGESKNDGAENGATPRSERPQEGTVDQNKRN